MHYPQYYYPIFSTYRNDVPLSQEMGLLEAIHVYELFHCYANKHNDHLSPYSELHPDPLERRIHQYPDVEVVTWETGDPNWYVGLGTSYALNCAYRHAREVFGEALQPVGWNRLEPWHDYDFTTELAQLRMPLIPQPEMFHEGAYHFPYESLTELQHTVHFNNFYAMCLVAYSIIINAMRMNHYHNLAYAGYLRGSPGFVSAERHWHRLHGFPVTDRSEDDESTAGELGYLSRDAEPELNRLDADFELIAQEQEDSTDALVAFTPPNTSSPMEAEARSPPIDINVGDRPVGAFRRNFGRSEHVHFVIPNADLLRSLRQRWDDFSVLSNASNAGPPPVVSSSIHDLDLHDLIERLEAISTTEPTGGADSANVDWEELPEPNATIAPSVESPCWPSTVQQATPPINWEDYWSFLHGEGIAAADGLSRGLAEHVIFAHPSVST